MNTQSTSGAAGGYLAAGAVINLFISWVTVHDQFFHACASILTAIAAVASIYFTVKRNLKG